MANANLNDPDVSPLQLAWTQLFEHCRKHGLGDVVTKVREGYAQELNSERQARHQMIKDAVTAERARCSQLVKAGDTTGHEGYIETIGDLLDAISDRLLRD